MTPKRLFDIPYFQAEKFPQEVMFGSKYRGRWQTLSTKQFINLGNATSRGLLKMGIKPGDKIALITSASRNEWAVMDFAILQIGAVTVPIYPTISRDEYEYIFNDSGVNYCFVSDAELYEKVLSAKRNAPGLMGVFTFDEVEGAPNWNEIPDLGKNETTQIEVDDLAKAIHEEDLATLIYTSGTTGKPKGVMLSHKNIVSNAKDCSHRIPKLRGVETSDTKALSFLPICHVFERMLFYMYQINGFSVYFVESIDKMSENMQEIKPHFMTVVPRVVEKVYDKIYQKGTEAGGFKSKIFHWALEVNEGRKEFTKPKNLREILADRLVFRKWREALGGNIAALICGSAALSERLNKIFNNAGIPILEGYGLTETSPVIAVNSFQKRKLGTVGIPLESCLVRIAEDGEITVKGPSVFLGYYNNEEMTRDVFTEDSFFKTGDIGHIDGEGYLKITDRKKEMFKTSGGKYIAPQVIENQAKASKFIEQIMVVGEGEKMPTALIQPDFDFAKAWAERKGHNIGNTPEEIAKNQILKDRIMQDIELLNKTLGNWEQIKKIELTGDVWSIDGGELTPTLKLKRKVIKEKYRDLIDQMYGRR